MIQSFIKGSSFFSASFLRKMFLIFKDFPQRFFIYILIKLNRSYFLYESAGLTTIYCSWIEFNTQPTRHYKVERQNFASLLSLIFCCARQGMLVIRTLILRINKLCSNFYSKRNIRIYLGSRSFVATLPYSASISEKSSSRIRPNPV